MSPIRCLGGALSKSLLCNLPGVHCFCSGSIPTCAECVWVLHCNGSLLCCRWDIVQGAVSFCGVCNYVHECFNVGFFVYCYLCFCCILLVWSVLLSWYDCWAVVMFRYCSTVLCWAVVMFRYCSTVLCWAVVMFRYCSTVLCWAVVMFRYCSTVLCWAVVMFRYCSLCCVEQLWCSDTVPLCCVEQLWCSDTVHCAVLSSCDVQILFHCAVLSNWDVQILFHCAVLSNCDVQILFHCAALYGGILYCTGTSTWRPAAAAPTTIWRFVLRALAASYRGATAAPICPPTWPSPALCGSSSTPTLASLARASMQPGRQVGTQVGIPLVLCVDWWLICEWVLCGSGLVWCGITFVWLIVFLV